MINNQYSIYIQNTFRLVETMLIKFEDAAFAMNEAVRLKYGVDAVDPGDKTSWKYYQNISGIYHFSDEEIRITSLDTLENIRFDKATLAQHPNTLKAYQYETRYYRSLLNQYPGRELLILGILYNEDKASLLTDVIAAKEGTIISFQRNLVEDNEFSLMTNIQNWIYDYLDRWVVRPFALSDDLYVATWMGQLYMQLVCLVINLRLRACKTNEVHSYHLRSYLASNSGLDVYLNYFTKEQALFFYRNILYIESYSGRQDTFEWLVENLFTKRSLPVVQFDSKHRQSNMLPKENNFFTLTHTPELVLERNFVNRVNISEVLVPQEFNGFIDKLNQLTPGNKSYHEISVNDMKDLLTYSPSSTIKTKFIESTVTDFKEFYTVSIEDIATNQWICDVMEGRFTGNTAISMIKNNRSLVLSPKDTLTFLMYLFNKSINKPTDVPIGRIVSDFCINDEFTEPYRVKYASEKEYRDIVISLKPENTACPNTTVFYTKVKAIFDSFNKIQYYMDFQEDEVACLELHQLRIAMYCKKNFQVSTETYDDWIVAKGIDLTEYTRQDTFDQFVDVLTSVTGLKENQSFSIKAIQAAMISAMQHLSSYSISFISDVKEQPLRLVRNKMPKPSNMRSTEFGHQYYEMTPILSRDTDHLDKGTAGADVAQFNATVSYSNTKSTAVFYNTILEFGSTTRLAPTTVKVENTNIFAGLPLDLSDFYALTPEQKQKLLQIS